MSTQNALRSPSSHLRVVFTMAKGLPLERSFSPTFNMCEEIIQKGSVPTFIVPKVCKTQSSNQVADSGSRKSTATHIALLDGLRLQLGNSSGQNACLECKKQKSVPITGKRRERKGPSRLGNSHMSITTSDPSSETVACLF